ncbi:hypothetical protein EA797_05025 [Stutzerimonas zhaodongensis]|uniref:Uncharacterized protein n=1 Tax=Stutzerimonas zhaodongensis TaxID=1176257 RepID=A0A3M2HQV5_9GAMM|nr:hypothetical protein EA797_05025 [Stutzerimonas zhaodongensis]
MDLNELVARSAFDFARDSTWWASLVWYLLSLVASGYAPMLGRLGRDAYHSAFLQAPYRRFSGDGPVFASHAETSACPISQPNSSALTIASAW